MARKSLSRRIRHRSSAALVLSAIAVFMSLGGVSYAVGKATIGTRAIQDNAVRGKDIRNGTVRGPDVLESSLKVVPSAKSAQTADSAQAANSVDGMSLAKVNFAAPTSTALTDVASIGGVTIQASCSGAGDVDVNARSDVEDSMIHVATIDGAAAYAEDDSFDVGQTRSLALPASHDNVHGSFTFATPNGSVVTGTYLIEEVTDGFGSPNDCFVKGTLVAG